jgi:hypothetical protein
MNPALCLAACERIASPFSVEKTDGTYWRHAHFPTALIFRCHHVEHIPAPVNERYLYASRARAPYHPPRQALSHFCARHDGKLPSAIHRG